MWSQIILFFTIFWKDTKWKNDGIQAFTSQMIVKLVVVARKQLLESGWKQSVSEST